MSSSSEGKCAICLVSATQQCAGCKAVFYCGREHQKQHWGRHRFECRPVKVAEDPVQGRYLVATKNISQVKADVLRPILQTGFLIGIRSCKHCQFNFT